MRIELELTNKQFQEISKGFLEYQKRIPNSTMAEFIVELTKRNSERELISLAEYSRLTGANPANLRQKIARGTLKAKKIENKWYIER
jgi:hypothetical protein